MPNGIDLILADHERVSSLFARFDESGDGTLVGQIVGDLIAHDEAEHGALYPIALVVLGDADLIAAFDDAHTRIKQLIEQLLQLEGPPLVDAVERPARSGDRTCRRRREEASAPAREGGDQRAARRAGGPDRPREAEGRMTKQRSRRELDDT